MMMIFLRLASIFLCLSLPTLVSSRSSCPLDNSRHSEAYGIWANRPNDTHRLSLLMPSLDSNAFRQVTEENLHDQIPLAGSTDCPTTLATNFDETLMGRSLCPWYWKMNYRSNRIPAMLPEAVCRCRRAVTDLKQHLIYECQPLTMHVRVLEFRDDSNCERYDERTIEIAVGCVSVVQSTVRLNKIQGVQRILHPQRPQWLQEIK